MADIKIAVKTWQFLIAVKRLPAAHRDCCVTAGCGRQYHDSVTRSPEATV